MCHEHVALHSLAFGALVHFRLVLGATQPTLSSTSRHMFEHLVWLLTAGSMADYTVWLRSCHAVHPLSVLSSSRPHGT